MNVTRSFLQGVASFCPFLVSVSVIWVFVSVCKVTHIHLSICQQRLSPVKRNGFDPEMQTGEIYGHGPLAPPSDSHFQPHHSPTDRT